MSQQKTVLRYLRRTREISIHALARETKINTSTLSLGERGLIEFSADQKAILSAYFKVSKEKLFSPFRGQAVA